MQILSFDEWVEKNKNSFFDCPECDGYGTIDDQDFDNVVTCPICCGDRKTKIKEMNKYQKNTLYKKSLCNDVRKYCEATGLDFDIEWEKIKL